jgi:tetratricopeptide (TPR) repeat protein
MAVDEREDVRVLVPADKSYRWGYGGKLSKVPIPYMTVEANKLKGRSNESGTLHWDISRTTQLPQAMDFFFDLPKGQRRWISAIGGDGYGFVQTSTDILQGRKLFVWGMGAGGRNWQSFLAQPGSAYLEIQAGLAHTQLEHLPMKGGATISWMEAYGPIKAEADVVQGKDWSVATGAIDRALEDVCPRGRVEEMHQKAQEELDGKVGRTETVGAGWALVQKELLGPDFRDGGLHFPVSSLGKREEPWLKLIREGYLPCPDVMEEPGSYQIGKDWEQLQEEALEQGGSRHWYGYFQYGVTLAYAGKMKEAEDAFDKSIQYEVNPWALRCKAVIRDFDGEKNESADLLVKAVNMLPERNLAKEALQALNRAGRPLELIELFDKFPREVQELGRLKVLLIEALLDIGETIKAKQMLDEKIELTDVREGEVKLTDLWFRMMAMIKAQESDSKLDDALLEQVKKECIPPVHLDFRMH